MYLEYGTSLPFTGGELIYVSTLEINTDVHKLIANS